MYKVFEKELNYIKNDLLREFVIDVLNNAPDYFYTVPASSSGKYHPKADLGEGGLVRHTKACVGIGVDLLRCEQFVKDTDDNRDIVVASLLLHDIRKNGIKDSQKTVFEHPLLACNLIKEVYSKSIEKYRGIRLFRLMTCIASHMGKWNTHEDNIEILPEPELPLEKLVHLADYIASRKTINFDFEA